MICDEDFFTKKSSQSLTQKSQRKGVQSHESQGSNPSPVEKVLDFKRQNFRARTKTSNSKDNLEPNVLVNRTTESVDVDLSANRDESVEPRKMARVRTVRRPSYLKLEDYSQKGTAVVSGRSKKSIVRNLVQKH